MFHLNISKKSTEQTTNKNKVKLVFFLFLKYKTIYFRILE